MLTDERKKYLRNVASKSTMVVKNHMTECLDVIEQQQEKIDELKQQLTEADENYIDLQNRYVEMESEARTMESEKSKQIDELKQEIKRLKDKNEDLEIALKLSNGDYKNVQKTCEERRLEIIKLKEELANTNVGSIAERKHEECKHYRKGYTPNDCFKYAIDKSPIAKDCKYFEPREQVEQICDTCIKYGTEHEPCKIGRTVESSAINWVGKVEPDTESNDNFLDNCDKWMEDNKDALDKLFKSGGEPEGDEQPKSCGTCKYFDNTEREYSIEWCEKRKVDTTEEGYCPDWRPKTSNHVQVGVSECAICSQGNTTLVTFKGRFVCGDCWEGLTELHNERYRKVGRTNCGACNIRENHKDEIEKLKEQLLTKDEWVNRASQMEAERDNAIRKQCTGCCLDCYERRNEKIRNQRKELAILNERCNNHKRDIHYFKSMAERLLAEKKVILETVMKGNFDYICMYCKYGSGDWKNVNCDGSKGCISFELEDNS